MQFWQKGRIEPYLMSKAAEEGEIWEWRAFGRVAQDLEKEVKTHPFRLDQSGIPLASLVGQDLYLISPASPHNIKLRRSFGGDWVLKFKLLLGTEARLIELYHESEKKSFRFPVRAAILRETAQLLQTAVPEMREGGMLDDQTFLTTIAQAVPAIRQVLVGKIRSQYQFADGWVELAEVTFPRAKTQSISLHAFRREAVEAMLDTLPLDGQLDVMNYLQACHKWGELTWD